MNLSDSERVAGILEASGLTLAENIEAADVAVFMTCCVREKADTQLFANVSALKNAPLPPSGKRTVMVGGCIAQRDGEKIRQFASNVDAVFGTQALSCLKPLLDKARAATREELKRSPLVDIDQPYTDTSEKLIKHPERNYAAWIPIIYGCNNFCSYCIVPYVRGRERSRLPEAILEEAKKLKSAGVKEVTLLGQNVNSYGKSFSGAEKNAAASTTASEATPHLAYGFADLLRDIAELGFERIRFTSSHPKDLTDGIIDVMASYDNIMPHLHLAVQSGSSAILKKMNRKYTREDYLALVKHLREKIPDLSLTTDLIVGFPGETEGDFEETFSLVKEANFDRAFTFIYSKREGTPAATWENGSTESEIHERFDRLASLIQEQSFKANQKEKGRIVDVLVEDVSKKDPSILVGHNPKNVTVHFPLPKDADAYAFIGQIVPVKIDEAKTWYLRGELADAN